MLIHSLLFQIEAETRTFYTKIKELIYRYLDLYRWL